MISGLLEDKLHLCRVVAAAWGDNVSVTCILARVMRALFVDVPLWSAFVVVRGMADPGPSHDPAGIP